MDSRGELGAIRGHELSDPKVLAQRDELVAGRPELISNRRSNSDEGTIEGEGFEASFPCEDIGNGSVAGLALDTKGEEPAVEDDGGCHRLDRSLNRPNKLEGGDLVDANRPAIVEGEDVLALVEEAEDRAGVAEELTLDEDGLSLSKLTGLMDS